MFERIIVPLDGSARAESVIPAALRFFRTPNVEIDLLVVVTGSARAAGEQETITASGSAAKEYLSTVADRLRGQGLHVVFDVRFGRPAEKILEHSESQHASLIAMSTHGRSGLERLVRGSVAEAVLRGATVPLLHLRSGAPLPGRDAPARRILVPLDGTADSESILPYVRYLAVRLGAGVELLRAAIPIPVHLGADPLAVQAGLPAADEYLGAMCRRLAEDGIEAESRSEIGSPAPAILARANSGQVGLVALATHAYGGIKRWLFGSVAEEVLRSVRVPTLVSRMAQAAMRPVSELTSEIPPG